MIPEHISYSQYNTYLSCPRSWYLGKVAKAEEVPTWYLAIGTAVHTMIEDHLGGSPDSPSAEEVFYPLIEEQMRVEPDLSKWLAGGPVTDPVTGDKALQKVKDCLEQALIYLDDWDVWEIEYDASGRLPNLDVPIKAFVDVIGEHKKHGPGIVDWKTGSKKPKDNFQLETYAALLKDAPSLHLESASLKGWWAMLDPSASKARPIDLSHVDPGLIGSKYQEVYLKMKAKHYQTNAGFMCKFCFHAPNCALISGPTPRALHYDKAEEDGLPY